MQCWCLRGRPSDGWWCLQRHERWVLESRAAFKGSCAHSLGCTMIIAALLALLGIIERGVPQAYVRARASSAALCLVHVLRVFLCNFDIKRRIWYVSKRAWIHIWYVSKPVPPFWRYPPYDYSNLIACKRTNCNLWFLIPEQAAENVWASCAQKLCEVSCTKRSLAIASQAP